MIYYLLVYVSLRVWGIPSPWDSQYIICHHDLPNSFETPPHVYAYTPMTLQCFMLHKYIRNQGCKRVEIEEHLQKLLEYVNDWHQTLNPNETELVVYHRFIESPKLNIYYKSVKITQTRDFKCVGFHLDSKLSFLNMINAQFVKLRKAYNIPKFIHQQLPSFSKLKINFLTCTYDRTCAW